MLSTRGRIGRPTKRADMDGSQVGMSFRVDGRLKNLFMDLADGYEISMVDLLAMWVLDASDYDSLDDYATSCDQGIHI